MWMVEMSEYFAANPQIIVNGFVKAGITGALDREKASEDQEEEDNKESETESAFDETESDFEQQFSRCNCNLIIHT